MDRASSSSESSSASFTDTGDFEAVTREGAGRNQALARFYMTSDLRAATGLTRTHLDFYLREGVIIPTARTESGYLLFDDEELSVLRQVISWRQHGLGVRDIRVRLGRLRDEDAS